MKIRRKADLFLQDDCGKSVPETVSFLQFIRNPVDDRPIGRQPVNGMQFIP